MTSLIAAIHVAKKQLGLDDETYRAKLTRIVGKASTKEMTEEERQRVLTVFRNEGFAPAPTARRPDGRAKLSGPYAGKLQAMWIAGWNLGIVRDKDDAALTAFVKRQTGLDAVRFLRDPDDARKAVEALKKMLEQKGGVSWKQNATAPILLDGQRIAYAQWRILNPENASGGGQFWHDVQSLLNLPAAAEPTKDQWIKVMNAWGVLVRHVKAGA